MFRRTDRQLPLLGAETGLGTAARQRLSSSWAEGFRTQVMPELLSAEERFARLYAGQGRPNWSVARLLALCLLQHQSGMSDQEALDALSFDIRWQHALSVTPEEAYLSRRSLVEFRRRLVEHDAEGELVREVFDRICAAGIAQLGLSTAEQRLDSTLVISNIRRRGRLSLGRATLRHFIKHLGESSQASLPTAVLEWYRADSESWEVDFSTRETGQQQLQELGRWAVEVLELFAKAEGVANTEPYRLLERFVREHAEKIGTLSSSPGGRDDARSSEHGDDDSDGANSSSSQPSGKPKQKEKGVSERSARYWSVHDPDASIGHKGLGYHAHFTETCRNGTTELLTDYHVVTAAENDYGQATAVVERLEQRQRMPDALYTDAGYPKPSELVAFPKRGIEFLAPVNRGALPVDSASRVDFEWDATTGRMLRCPEGHAPTRHGERQGRRDTLVPRDRSLYAYFDANRCLNCPRLQRCPVRAPNNRRSREFRLDLAPTLWARDARWAEQKTEPFRERYRIRSGVEATMSELKRAHSLGRLRMRRMVRVRLQIAFKATACNVKRWLRALLAAFYSLLQAIFSPRMGFGAASYLAM